MSNKVNNKKVNGALDKLEALAATNKAATNNYESFLLSTFFDGALPTGKRPAKDYYLYARFNTGFALDGTYGRRLKSFQTQTEFVEWVDKVVKKGEWVE